MAFGYRLGHAGAVEPEPVPDLGAEARAQQFEAVFGVSEAELRSQGIDPRDYIHRHFSEALAADPSKADLLGIPRSQVLLTQSLKWGWRFYKLLFLGIALLVIVAIRPPSPIRISCLALAVVVFIAAAWMMRRQLRNYRQYKEACTKEGTEPLTPWGRPTPRWRRRLAGK